MKKEIYFSVDVEADGPIPGVYSMSSFGIFCAGYRETDTGDDRLVRFNAEDTSKAFYRELKPISDDFVPAAAAVSNLSREQLITSGADPVKAMKEAKAFVDKICANVGGRPLMAASPSGFDFTFMHWYFMRYLDEDPFGFSGVVDLRSFVAGASGRTLTASTKNRLPKSLRSKRAHTHNALDDAVEQGETFMNIFAQALLDNSSLGRRF